MSEKLLRFTLLVGVFVLAWFSILVVIFGAPFVWAILLDTYEWGGLIALALLAVFLVASAALLAYALVRATLVKGAWNIATDPPGSARNGVWGSPEQP